MEEKPKRPPAEEDYYAPPPRYYRRRLPNPITGCLWELVRMVVYMSLPLLVVGALVLLGFTTITNVFNGVRTIFEGAPGPVEVIAAETLVTRIQGLGRFVSLEIGFANPEILVRNIQQGGLTPCSFEARHIAEGTIEAGVDLSLLTEQDIAYDTESNTYTLYLPPANLTSCRIDQIIQYDPQQTFCRLSWDEVRRLAQYTATTEMIEKAYSEDILGRAQSEARDGIGAFVQLVTNANVVIEFRQPDTSPEATQTPLPDSCQPQPPEGWVYNEANGFWQQE